MALCYNSFMKVSPTLNLQQYEEINMNAYGASAFLTMSWERLGKPADPISTENGRKLMEIIIHVWAKELTREYVEWKEIRDEYQKHELSIKEQVKEGTGRSLASYPMFVYQIMKKLFPTFDPIERKNCIKLVKLFPIFRFVNKV